MKITITNELPNQGWDEGLPNRILEIFRGAMPNNPTALPFDHQIHTFKEILSDRQVYLVAGTASGKTLAIGAPLFHKLECRKTQKVLIMYPTIALLEDQIRIMRNLADVTGLGDEIGHIQGGMSRSQLIHNLNKRVILATPDEIYWFFRKNVKYNSLLIYGLCQVDEFILDEAHLFNGLMLRNFEHL